MKKKLYLTIDTETYGTIEMPYAYDVGGIVHDKYGKEYERFSFAIFETYVLRNSEVQKAFYASKLPQYDQEILAGTRQVVSIKTVREYLLKLCQDYEIEAILAYNANFDFRSLRNTWNQDYWKLGKFWEGFPKIYCTMQMCYDTIFKHKMYDDFCYRYGFVSAKTGKPRHSAEVAYRYSTLDTTFVEEHIGIYDCEIEKELFANCMRQHKKMRRTNYNKVMTG